MTTLGAAVERTARALGVWRHPEDGPAKHDGWLLSHDYVSGGLLIGRWTTGCHTPDSATPIDVLTAALVLLCHVLPETQKRCPDCKTAAASRPLSPRAAKYGRGVCSGCGALVALTKAGLVRSHCGAGPGPRCDGIKLPPLAARPCPTCSPTRRDVPTGYVHQSWAEVLLDAMPRPCDACNASGLSPATRSSGVTECWKCQGHKTASGSNDARERIAVLADELLTSDRTCPACKRRSLPRRKRAGHEWMYATSEARAQDADAQGWTVGYVLFSKSGPREIWPCSRPCSRCTVDGEPTGCDTAGRHALGEWLALWLAEVPCRSCAGDRRVLTRGSGWRDVLVDCPACRGSGLELGAHTPAIIEALGRLAGTEPRATRSTG